MEFLFGSSAKELAAAASKVVKESIVPAVSKFNEFLKKVSSDNSVNLVQLV